MGKEIWVLNLILLTSGHYENKAALIDFIENHNIELNEDLYEAITDALEKIVEAHTHMYSSSHVQ